MHRSKVKWSSITSLAFLLHNIYLFTLHYLSQVYDQNQPESFHGKQTVIIYYYAEGTCSKRNSNWYLLLSKEETQLLPFAHNRQQSEAHFFHLAALHLYQNPKMQGWHVHKHFSIYPQSLRLKHNWGLLWFYAGEWKVGISHSGQDTKCSDHKKSQFRC